jgi:hypothetical protein
VWAFLAHNGTFAPIIAKNQRIQIACHGYLRF